MYLPYSPHRFCPYFIFWKGSFCIVRSFGYLDMSNTQTIAAVSTAYGKGGIAVIRISGPEALPIAEKIFRPVNGRPFSQQLPSHMTYGSILDAGDGFRRIDDGMAVWFKAPHSYTGEDTVELNCHGGMLLTRTILESVLLCGAQPAGPGEFTRRAFIAGKLGLSQAEAVINLIDAETHEKLRLAASHAGGVLQKKIARIHDEIMKMVSSVYAYVDFPDEDMTDLTPDELYTGIDAIRREIQRTADTYRAGKAVCEGIRTVIVGRPNTGKSSLMNLLIGEERAIVTADAGTTRDTIEETVSLGRVLLRLCDTAGIRREDDTPESEAERMGIERSNAKMQDADLILAVFDGSSPLPDTDRAFLNTLSDLPALKIAVINKSDLPKKLMPDELSDRFDRVISLSCRTGEGKDVLTAAIEGLYFEGSIDYEKTAVVVNARQYSSLKKAEECLENALNSLEGGLTQDVAGLDLENALSCLAEVDGRTVSEAIVSDIFSRFCVGK